MTSAVAAASSATRMDPETATAAAARPVVEAAKGTNPEDRSCPAPVVVTTTNWKSSTNTIQSRRHRHHGPNRLQLHHTCDAVRNSYCCHHHPHLDAPSLNPQSTSARPQTSETSISSSSAGCPATTPPSPPNSNSEAITKVVTVRGALPPAAIQCTSTCTAGATATAAMAAAEAAAATTGTTRQDVEAEEVVVSASGKRRHQFQSHLLSPSALYM